MRRSTRTGQYHSVRQRRCYQVASVTAPALLVLAYTPIRGAADVAVVIIQAVLLELLLLVGPAAMTVTVDPDFGVTVRNMFRTTRIGWGDMRGVRIDDGFPWIARVERVNGPEVVAWALSAEPWLSWGTERARITRMVDELNAAWRQAVLSTGRPGAVRIVEADQAPLEPAPAEAQAVPAERPTL